MPPNSLSHAAQRPALHLGNHVIHRCDSVIDGVAFSRQLITTWLSDTVYGSKIPEIVRQWSAAYNEETSSASLQYSISVFLLSIFYNTYHVSNPCLLPFLFVHTILLGTGLAPLPSAIIPLAPCRPMTLSFAHTRCRSHVFLHSRGALTSSLSARLKPRGQPSKYRGPWL